MNQQHVTLLVLLDLSAAFGNVVHPILLDGLHTDFGISDNVHSWFKSNLHEQSRFYIFNMKSDMGTYWSLGGSNFSSFLPFKKLSLIFSHHHVNLKVTVYILT